MPIILRSKWGLFFYIVLEEEDYFIFYCDPKPALHDKVGSDDQVVEIMTRLYERYQYLEELKTILQPLLKIFSISFKAEFSSVNRFFITAEFLGEDFKFIGTETNTIMVSSHQLSDCYKYPNSTSNNQILERTGQELINFLLLKQKTISECLNQEYIEKHADENDTLQLLEIIKTRM